jgi:hypothetical protein
MIVGNQQIAHLPSIIVSPVKIQLLIAKIFAIKVLVAKIYVKM